METAADMSLNEAPKWPKKVPQLTNEQQEAKEEWMKYWHELLPTKYGAIENFNHGYVAKFANNLKSKIKTLEFGAGLGEHLKWEKTDFQDYYILEYREDWCKTISSLHPNQKVIHGDIQKKLSFSDEYFDRVIAIHVLEHLSDLPSALVEVYRILKRGGFFDIVIPCEGGLAYEFARKISSERLFVKKFNIPYKPIIQAEHLSTYTEILHELSLTKFSIIDTSYYPLKIQIGTANLCIGMRLQKK